MTLPAFGQAQPPGLRGDDLFHVLLAGVPPMVGSTPFAVLQGVIATGDNGWLPCSWSSLPWSSR